MLQARIAARMRRVRLRLGLTQDAVAGRLGIALRNYQRMESGRQNLTLRTIERVAHAFGVVVGEIVQVADDKPTP